MCTMKSSGGLDFTGTVVVLEFSELVPRILVVSTLLTRIGVIIRVTLSHTESYVP